MTRLEKFRIKIASRIIGDLVYAKNLDISCPDSFWINNANKGLVERCRFDFRRGLIGQDEFGEDS